MMREITSYQAFDGKLFNNKCDCAAYEAEHYAYLTEISVSLEFLDCNTKRLNTPAPADKYFAQQLEDAYNLAKYLIIHNDLSDAAIEYLNEELGWSFPREEGEYRYGEEENCWIRFTTDVTNFCKEWGMTVRELIKRLTP